MGGYIEATGLSFVPTQAYVWVNLTQVAIDDTTQYNAVADQPDGKAADENGSQSDVTGSGSLNTIPSLSQLSTRAALSHVTL